MPHLKDMFGSWETEEMKKYTYASSLICEMCNKSGEIRFLFMTSFLSLSYKSSTVTTKRGRGH